MHLFDQAKITIVEFTDYQCPFCNKFHLNTYPKLKKQFVDSGLVWFVSRDLPLDFYQHAFEAARAARCAQILLNSISLHPIPAYSSQSSDFAPILAGVGLSELE